MPRLLEQNPIDGLLKSHKPEEAENNYGDMIIRSRAEKLFGRVREHQCFVREAALVSAFSLTVFTLLRPASGLRRTS